MKRFVAVAAALVMTLAMAGCSSKSSSSTVKEKEAADMFISRAAFDKDFDGVEDIEKGPVLGIENVTAKAGETVKVSITVDTPDHNWAMCGLHITYPEDLQCELEEDNETVKCAVGEACGGNPLTSTMKWHDELPEDLAAAHRNMFFFAALLRDDDGTSGKIATFSFKIPDDAESGDTYDLSYYYHSSDRSKDMFTTIDNDKAYEKYAFSHFTGGTITVE